MENFKISIIVPVYNAEEYLKQCLDSIVNQTYKNIEIICINDASTDNSLSILKEYEKNDSRIKVLSGEHIGAGKARNLGIEKSTGDYLLFLDCDDFFELNMIEEMLNKITIENSDIVVCNSYVFDNQNNTDTLNDNNYKHVKKSPINPQDYPQDLFTFIDGCAWNKIFKASIVKENAILFEDLTSCNDITFTDTMLALANSISLLKQAYVHYRTNQKNNISANRGDKAVNGIYAINALENNLKKHNLWNIFSKTFYHKAKGVFLNELLYCNEEQRRLLIDCANKNLPKELFEVFISALNHNKKNTKKIKLFGIIPFVKIITKGETTTTKIWGIPLVKTKKTPYKTKFYFCGIPIIKASTKQ